MIMGVLIGYEASVISGQKVSITPAMNELKKAAGRKISGADLQAIQAVITAVRKSQGETFDELPAFHWPPLLGRATQGQIWPGQPVTGRQQ